MKFATNVKSAAMILSSGTRDEGVLLNRLENGLPKRIKYQAALTSGSYNELIGTLGSLSIVKSSRERVCSILEGSLTQAQSNTPGQNWQETEQFHYCKDFEHIEKHCPEKRRDKELPRTTHGKEEVPKTIMGAEELGQSIYVLELGVCERIFLYTEPAFWQKIEKDDLLEVVVEALNRKVLYYCIQGLLQYGLI